MSRFSLAGKTAVVTGGSRGIGRAIALGLAEAGADVVFTYRAQIAEAEDVGNQIMSMGRRALALHMDVTNRASVEKAAEDSKKLGPVSILVNNAGINKPTDFDQVTDADWDHILATNLKGPFICA
jgi:3-oxoacyl-[acyl-carrier protein] reductase